MAAVTPFPVMSFAGNGIVSAQDTLAKKELDLRTALTAVGPTRLRYSGEVNDVAGTLGLHVEARFEQAHEAFGIVGPK